MLQIFSPQTVEEFFASFPYLNDFYGDERLDFHDIKEFNTKDFRVDLIHNIYFDVQDVKLLNNLLDTLKLGGYQGNFILASDYEVYGYKSAKRTPIDERDECKPESDRGKMAFDLEDACNSHRKGAQYGTIILRYGVVYGPYQDANVLSDIMQQALLNHDIELWPPGSRSFDFLYVTDAVRAAQCALNVNPIPGAIDIYNIGSGYEVKIGNVARDIRHLVKSDSTITYKPISGLPQAKGYHTKLNIEKASKQLGWDPFTETQKGFLQTAWWMQGALPPEEVKYGAQNIVKTFPQLSEEFGKLKAGETELTIDNDRFMMQFREAGAKHRKDISAGAEMEELAKISSGTVDFYETGDSE